MGLGLDDLVANCVTDQVAERGQTEFVHNVRSVGFDRTRADIQRRCHLFVALTFG